jgi:hypothetical protein
MRAAAVDLALELRERAIEDRVRDVASRERAEGEAQVWIGSAPERARRGSADQPARWQRSRLRRIVGARRRALGSLEQARRVPSFSLHGRTSVARTERPACPASASRFPREAPATDVKRGSTRAFFRPDLARRDRLPDTGGRVDR